MIEAIRAFQLAMTIRSDPWLATVQGSHGRSHDGAETKKARFCRWWRAAIAADEKACAELHPAS
jgi:hypothetical protein